MSMQRRIVQSLFSFSKCFRLDGPNYISQFFTPRRSNYNLRGGRLNVAQPSNNRLVMHDSFLYTIAHMWTSYQLPPNPQPLWRNFVLVRMDQVCSLQGANVSELYFMIQIFSIRTSCSWNILHFNSEFIIANSVVIVSSNYVMSLWLYHSLRSRVKTQSYLILSYLRMERFPRVKINLFKTPKSTKKKQIKKKKKKKHEKRARNRLCANFPPTSVHPLRSRPLQRA